MKLKLSLSLLIIVGFYLQIEAQISNKYLKIVQNFSDKLLESGLDHYGTRQTAMWASVIDLEDLSVPIRGVPITEGVRASDRAVGGSNYYHDLMTMKVFEALSDLTEDSKYRNAVLDYSKDFLSLTQNPETGLLGWGEHLYWDFYRDTVTVSESRLFTPERYHDMPHELLAWTPPWNRLWNIDSDRTAAAIKGLMWHFQGPNPKTYLFNRHAFWNKAEYQKEIMPWIKHSVLYAYSWAFLFNQTGDAIWKQRAKDIALLYWNLRDQETNLLFHCFFHATEPSEGKTPQIASTGEYAYWMYKTGEILDDENLKEIAKKIVLAYGHYGWNEENQFFYKSVNLDGTLVEKPERTEVWKIGYGSAGLFSFATAVNYIASKEEDESLIELALKCEQQVAHSTLPDHYTAQNVGGSINFYLDLYEITKELHYLEEARKYCDIGIENFSHNGMISRQSHDRYYEAKLGTGDLLVGYFRLGMINDGKENKLAKYDFSY